MSPPPPNQPSLPWRATSSLIMGVTGFLSRSFLFRFNNTEVIGLDRFLQVLDGRKDVEARDRGLLTGTPHPLSLEIGCCADESAVTVSNHISMCVRVIENVKAVLPGYEKNRRLMEI
jgi:hypothetical protein